MKRPLGVKFVHKPTVKKAINKQQLKHGLVSRSLQFVTRQSQTLFGRALSGSRFRVDSVLEQWYFIISLFTFCGHNISSTLRVIRKGVWRQPDTDHKVSFQPKFSKLILIFLSIKNTLFNQKRERKKLATDSRWIGMAAEFIPVFSPADTNSGGGKILEMHVRQLCNLEPLQTRKSWWRYTSKWDRKIRDFGINLRDENVGTALRDIAENADCVTEGNLRLRRTHCEVVSFPGPPQNRTQLKIAGDSCNWFIALALPFFLGFLLFLTAYMTNRRVKWCLEWSFLVKWRKVKWSPLKRQVSRQVDSRLRGK